MTLAEKQQKFVYLVAKLVTWSYEQGYRLTFGEAYRTQEQAAFNALHGSGIRNSLHNIRLAIDLNLFITSKYRSDSESYRVLGNYWKSLDPDCAWGGDFSKPDGNHFSLAHDGIK